jgi:hypothetical protein
MWDLFDDMCVSVTFSFCAGVNVDCCTVVMGSG